MDLHSLPVRTAAFAAGVALHQLAFKRGEWDVWATTLVSVFLMVQAFAVLVLQLVPISSLPPSLSQIHNHTANNIVKDRFTYQTISDNRFYTDNLGRSVTAIAGLGLSLVAGLTLSILTYRAFFHRLNRFPGPFAARLSNFYPTYLSAKKLHLYEEVEQLHRQYGDFVRLGPQELSVNHPKAVAAINSAQSPCTKGPWYNNSRPRVSLQTVRDKKEHAKRRKVWDRAFGSKALRDYEPRVKTYTDQLLAQIQANLGKPMNVSEWFNFYSFDVMGDLAFGKPFGMLRDGVKTYFMQATHDDMMTIGYLAHLVWLLPFLLATPVLNSTSIKFWKWLRNQLDQRIKNPPAIPDVFSHILEEYEKGPKDKQARLDLDEDAHLIVVAGSDTTAATLTCVFWHLAQEPAQIKSLRVEVDEYYRVNGQADANGLAQLKHLDAVINESLRLHPPVPSGVQRVTPADGLQIGETFIPGNTIVQIPMHTQSRDPRNFVQPNSFIPERWTTKSELVLNPGNSIPFSVGPYGCVGKQLALTELRYVISQIVNRYDVRFADGQTAKQFALDKKDNFTLACGKLELVFTERKSG